MVDPNKAFRDRNRSKHDYPVTIKFAGDSHLVTFTCPKKECGYVYDAMFNKGMTLYTNSIGCPECNTQMDYHID